MRVSAPRRNESDRIGDARLCRHVIMPHRTTVKFSRGANTSFSSAKPDERDYRDPGQHHIGVEEFLRAENQPAQSPRNGGEHFDRDQNAPCLRQAEPKAGDDVGQRAGQDDVPKQPAIVGAHGLRRTQPDLLHRFHAGPGIVDDRKSGNESDQRNGGNVAGAEPQQEKRSISEARESARRCSPAAAKYLRPGANGP